MNFFANNQGWRALVLHRLWRPSGLRETFSLMRRMAIICIAFSVATLLTVVTLVDSFQEAYRRAILGFNGHVLIASLSEESADPSEVIPQIESFALSKSDQQAWKNKKLFYFWKKAFGFDSESDHFLATHGIVSYSPFLFQEGLGVTPVGMKGVALKGIDPKKLSQVYAVTEHIKNPELWLDQKQTMPPVILGSELFRDFFGDRAVSDHDEVGVFLTSSHSESKAELKHFKVVGTFESGLHDFDARFLLIPLPYLQKLVPERKLSGFEASLDDPEKAPLIAEELLEKVPNNWDVVPWTELNGSLFTALKMERTVFFILTLLLVLIASSLMVGVVILMVWQFRKSLAVLLALGATRNDLKTILSMHGMRLAFYGVVFGIVGALVFIQATKSWLLQYLDPQVYYVTDLAIKIQPKIWGGMIGLVIILCLVVARLAVRQSLKKSDLKTFIL